MKIQLLGFLLVMAIGPMSHANDVFADTAQNIISALLKYEAYWDSGHGIGGTLARNIMCSKVGSSPVVSCRLQVQDETGGMAPRFSQDEKSLALYRALRNAGVRQTCRKNVCTLYLGTAHCVSGLSDDNHTETFCSLGTSNL